jgi:type II secretory pathway pseudopilin PulG
MTIKMLQKNKGFTLIETMFAVLILTFAITSMMSIVASNLFAARYAKDETTANYLLQEVVDYIRNDRDTTVFLGSGAGSTTALWNSFYAKYSNCTSDTKGCYFDVFNSSTPTMCLSTGCPPLYYDANASTTPFYVSESGSTSGLLKTNFRRKIVVKQNVSNLDEIDVTVTVDWKNGGLPISRSLTASFVNWQQ